MQTQRRVTIGGGGAIALDENVVLDAELQMGKARVVAREFSYGGNTATALVTIALNHADARWIGYLPSGPTSGGSREDLESFGVDTSAATATTTPPIRSTVLATPSGDRFIAFDDDTLVGFPPTVDERILHGIDVLLVDQYASSQPEIIHAARQLRIPVVADIERADWPDADRIVRVADHLVVPLHFAAERAGAVGGDDAVSVLWGSQHSAVVVTDGENGAWYREATTDHVVHVPSFPVDVVDTSGCGDVFHGIYALAIGEGRGVGEAVVRASAAGALAATGRGGRGRIPRASDIDDLVATRSFAPTHN
jgi:sugar/nucleoside kinase (ribokinase family)